MKGIFTKLLFAMMIAFIPLVSYAKENSIDIPCEVKFLLDEKILDSNDKTKLSKTYRKALGLRKVSQIKVAYIDTDKNLFRKEGWINRLRTKENSNGLEYTFKKRYPIVNGNIEAAMECAKRDGLIDAAGFVSKIDWGFDEMSLDFKCNKSIPPEENGFPSLPDAINTVKNIMPEQEIFPQKNENGTKSLDSARFIGPITTKCYKGKFCDQKITLELWPIENPRTKEIRYIAELSFDASSTEEAKLNREIMLAKLSEMKILKNEGSLKTSMMFDAYKN